MIFHNECFWYPSTMNLRVCPRLSMPGILHIRTAIPQVIHIYRILSLILKNGLIAHVPLKRKMSSPKREAAKIELEKMVAEFPSLSIRKAASALSISPTLVYKIYTDDLHLSAYKFHLWHKLEDKDYEKRVKFALWFLEQPASVLDHMIFSDEAFFYLTLPVNKHNNRIWSQSTPLIGMEKPLHDMNI